MTECWLRYESQRTTSSDLVSPARPHLGLPSLGIKCSNTGAWRDDLHSNPGTVCIVTVTLTISNGAGELLPCTQEADAQEAIVAMVTSSTSRFSTSPLHSCLILSFTPLNSIPLWPLPSWPDHLPSLKS
jgi:hypothetical protein